jgi:hypothetical protein
MGGPRPPTIPIGNKTLMADAPTGAPPAAGAPPAPGTPGAPGAPASPPPRRGPGHRGQDIRDTVAEMAAKAQEISMEAGSKMAAAMKDVINAAAGISSFAIESARDLVQYMVRRGQMTQEEADKLIREVEESQARRKSARPAPAPEKPAAKASAKPAAKADAKPAAKTAAKPAAKATAKPAAKSAAPKPAAKGAAPKKSAPAKTAKKPAAKAPARPAAKKHR